MKRFTGILSLIKGLKIFKRKSKNRRSKSPLLSFLLSLFIHALVILLLGLSFSRFFSKAPISETNEKEAMPTVIFDLSPSPSREHATVETSPENAPRQAPREALFESDNNSISASESAPTGDAPLPSQLGREQKELELKNQEHTLGEKPHESSGAEQSLAQEPSAPVITSPPEKTEPAITSFPERNEKIVTLATPAPTPMNTPAMGALSPEAKAKGYQAEERPSIIRGNISNKGKASIAAEATPIGHYKKNLADAIGSRWYYYVDERMGLLSIGTVTVSFYVTQQGKIEKLRVVSNSSNQTFADCCIKSILEAKLPVISPEVAETLQHGKLEIEYSFTIYSH